MSTSTPTLYPAVTPLHAGPVALLFSNGDLRQLRVGNVELVQRIYVAVRDHNWGTIPATLQDLAIDDLGASFRISFTAVHTQGDIGFTWQGLITGDATGTITFSLDGKADTTFRRNRIGFCVLHPADAAGAACTLDHPDGSRTTAHFPELIAPHQPFLNLRAITHEAAPGLRAEVRFSGDIFETEDQRNWTDASFKTYSTPLSLPYPVTIEAGETVQQSVTLQLHGQPPLTAVTSAPQADLQVGRTPVGRLPALGLGMASHGDNLSATEIAHLRALRLAHLRLDLDLAAPDLAATLAQAAAAAAALDTALEIALFVGEDIAPEFAKLRGAWPTPAPHVARWMIFPRQGYTTGAGVVDMARPTLRELAPNAPIGGGTNLYFTQLNRFRPPAAELDFVTYSINPQVHAFDNLSLVENMTAQGYTVQSARAFCHDKPIVISPITLRPRANPDATGPAPVTPPDQLPDTVDVRQSTRFAAAWTLGSISRLAATGAAALTYFETTGWRGIMATATGSALPDLFYAPPGMRFPLYHLFAALADFVAADCMTVELADPQRIAALALHKEGRQRLLVANLLDQIQRIEVAGLHTPVDLHTLDDDAGSIELVNGSHTIRLDLPPYAIVRLDTV
jgi:hypothetical protein